MDLALYIQDKLRMSEQTEQVLKVGLASRLSRGKWPCPSCPCHSSHKEQCLTAKRRGAETSPSPRLPMWKQQPGGKDWCQGACHR